MENVFVLGADAIGEEFVDSITEPLEIALNMIGWLMDSELGILIAFVLSMWLISMAIGFYGRYTWWRR